MNLTLKNLTLKNLELNLENLNLLVSVVLSMKLIDVNNNRYHYYKKCIEGEFGIIREYWLDVYEESGYIFIKRTKEIDGESTNGIFRSYKIDNENWWVIIDDFAMRTFSAADSPSEDDMIDFLKKTQRNILIDSILK